MKKLVQVLDDYKITTKYLKLLGFKATKPRHINSNGPDLFAVNDSYVLSVEIKKAIKPKGKNVFRIRKVEINRINDDLISIVFPNGYALIEPMKDHLKSCNKSGDRHIYLGPV